MLENNRPKKSNKIPEVLLSVVILFVLFLIGFALYQSFYKKNADLELTEKTTNFKNNTSETKVILSGIVQKLTTDNDGKSGTLYIKTVDGLPQDNKPMAVYQVQVDDSVLVNSISPAKSASETKPISVPIKWKDIKVNKYINVNLNKELGSTTTVKLNVIKNIEVVEN